MKLKTYGRPHAPWGEKYDKKAPESGYSASELERNYHLLTTDVECPWCGKLQAVMETVYLGGPCKRCGKLTSGAEKP